MAAIFVKFKPYKKGRIRGVNRVICEKFLIFSTNKTTKLSEISKNCTETGGFLDFNHVFVPNEG